MTTCLFAVQLARGRVALDVRSSDYSREAPCSLDQSQMINIQDG